MPPAVLVGKRDLAVGAVRSRVAAALIGAVVGIVTLAGCGGTGSKESSSQVFIASMTASMSTTPVAYVSR